MVNLVDLRNKNSSRWNQAKLSRNFTSVAKALVAPQAKTRYQAVSAKTGVPWFIIAVIHEREASQDWKTQLGQGDPLNKVSVHVPRGRGPFTTWEDGAYDALVNCPPYAAKNKDWSPGGALTTLEEYNGLGYASRNLPSPYVWSGTDQYSKGKYVRDGVFDPNVIDVQLGCAGLIKTMMVLDNTIKFGPQDAIPTIIAAPLPPLLTNVKNPTTTASSSMSLVAVSSGIAQNETPKDVSYWRNFFIRILGK